MKFGTSIFFTFLFLISTSAFAGEPVYVNAHLGDNVTVSGYVTSIPVRFEAAYKDNPLGFESFNFDFAPDSVSPKFGDTYYLVKFHTVILGKTVGTWNYKKGDRITLTGRHFKFLIRETGQYGKANSGLMGSLHVNDLALEQPTVTAAPTPSYESNRAPAAPYEPSRAPTPYQPKEFPRPEPRNYNPDPSSEMQAPRG